MFKHKDRMTLTRVSQRMGHLRPLAIPAVVGVTLLAVLAPPALADDPIKSTSDYIAYGSTSLTPPNTTVHMMMQRTWVRRLAEPSLGKEAAYGGIAGAACTVLEERVSAGKAKQVKSLVLTRKGKKFAIKSACSAGLKTLLRRVNPFINANRIGACVDVKISITTVPPGVFEWVELRLPQGSRGLYRDSKYCRPEYSVPTPTFAPATQKPVAPPPSPVAPPPLPPVNHAPVITSVNPPSGTIVGSTTPRLEGRGRDDDGDTLEQLYRITGPSTDVSSGWLHGAWTVPAHKLDPGGRYDWSVTVRDSRGATVTARQWLRVGLLPTATELVSVSTSDGYWQVASDGGVFAYGTAGFFGSVPGLNIHLTNIIGMARTPDDGGYWLVGSDGGVFSFGDAPFAGSLPGLNVHIDNIVGMAPTKDGHGYWLVAGDGGVFSFGTAQFYGSMGGQHLNAPVTRMAPTASGNGYWLVARDGGVLAFGDAPFYGSMGSRHLNAPVVDIDVAPDGAGYWMTAEDGGVFAFGSAQFFGSIADQHLNGHITSMSRTSDGAGYWLNGCDGGIFTFGNAMFFGSNPTYHCRGT